ncbi:MAG: alanine racemase [Oscillospiraceae bacterium]|nr:alanine racemase [Oscillospiraceae bacterium]
MTKELYIEKSLLKKNYQEVCGRLSGAHLLAVLKNNAYGLGLLPMARFWREAGIRRFGVGDPSDAAQLRAEGFTSEEILLLRSTAVPEEINALLDHNVIATVGSQEAALALSGIAEKRSAVAEAHICIDCGTGTYGFLPRETDKIYSIFSYMQNIAVSGVYTHLPGNLSLKKARACLDEFDGVLSALREQTYETGLVHALGSTALFRHPGLPQYDLVRVGAAMTGRIPGKTGLSHVGAVIAPVTDVRWIPAGALAAERLKLRRSIRAGLIPVGYADGALMSRPAYTKLFSLTKARRGHGKVHVKLDTGEEAAVLGMIGQNHMLVDLTQLRAAAGTLARVEVDPLFAGTLARRVQ